MSRRVGFTLIEMLSVVVILGLMTAFIAPRIDLMRYRMNSATQVMGTSILAAQRQALTQQHNVIVYFDAANRRIRIHEDRNNNAAIDGAEHVRAVNLGDNVVFGRGGATAMAMGSGPIAIAKQVGGLPAVVFHRDGSASETGGFYITSISAERDGIRPQDSRAVLIAQATGRATWFRIIDGNWVKEF